jgi:hypothetical protein
MARPKKDINWEIVEKRMEAGCSAQEIAGAIPCDLDTFYRRFKEEFGSNFGDYSDKYYRAGNGNLRYTQYMKALSGNTHMLTLLGRERLEQGAIKEEVPTNDELLSLKHENMLLRAELDGYKEVVDGDKPQAE